MIITTYDDGVTFPKGFTASGVHAGFRKNRAKLDLALIMAEKAVPAAAVYTTNTVKGAPLVVTKKHLENGYARAIIVNSGNANTCNDNGIEIAEKTCSILADKCGMSADDVIVASTGVIGQRMSIEPFAKGIPELVDSLSVRGGEDAMRAIMTTDTVPKRAAAAAMINGRQVRIGGIAKGSGMICPNMATLLAFVTTDAVISPEALKRALDIDVKKSFNMVTIDGDTSTNDMFAIMASGAAGNEEIKAGTPAFMRFAELLSKVTASLCKQIAADGEGATKAIECRIKGAQNIDIAKKAAKAVAGSALVKAAIFGADANWGRVLCALGYSDEKLSADKADVTFISSAGEIAVCRDGFGADFSEEKAKEILSAREITIDVDLHSGEAVATAWGCDLTYDYVKINGDYRT